MTGSAPSVAALTDADTDPVQVAVRRLAAATDPAVSLPLPAVRAAVLLERAARAAIRRHVAQAREAGLSWDELAPALDTGNGPDDDGLSAYEWVTGPHGAGGGVVHWRCPSCQELVTDSGPYGDHPDDNETGHAADCARRAAEVAAWRRRTRDRDDHASDRCACCDGGAV